MTRHSFHKAPFTSWDKNHRNVLGLKLCQNNGWATSCHLSVFGDQHLKIRDWDCDRDLIRAINMMCLVAIVRMICCNSPAPCCISLLSSCLRCLDYFGFESPTHNTPTHHVFIFIFARTDFTFLRVCARILYFYFYAHADFMFFWGFSFDSLLL